MGEFRERVEKGAGEKEREEVCWLLKDEGEGWRGACFLGRVVKKTSRRSILELRNEAA